MEQIKIQKFLSQRKDYLFPNNDYTEQEVAFALLEAPDGFVQQMVNIPYRNPSLFRLIALALGSFGIDRFYLGDYTKGFLKLMTAGGMLIWWFADVISAKKRCRAYNCKKLMEAINDPEVIAEMQKLDANINKTIATGKKYAPVIKGVAKGAKNVRNSFFGN